MVRRNLVLAALCLCVAAAPAAIRLLHPAPPGAVVQDKVVYLSGEGMSSRWHVVASRVQVGKQNGKDAAYQWYLSIYRPAADSFRLAYRSPGAGDHPGLLATVVKASGADLYFPLQTLSLAGSGELEQPGIQDAVVTVHESAADCGSSTVVVFGFDAPASQVVQKVRVTNPCDLRANVIPGSAPQAVRLTGPYYNRNAPLCCPTKPRAVATLALRNGRWVVSPTYFTIARSSSR